MVGTVSRGFLNELERRRAQVAAAAEGMLLECRAQGREQLNAGEAHRHAQAMADLRGLDEHIAEIREDLDRSGLGRYAHLGRGAARTNTAGRLSPLGYTDEALRRAFDQINRGEAAVLAKRDPGFAGPLTPLVPPELGPILPVFPRHEDRLLDRLPGVGIDVPAIAYVQVVSTTGTAGIVAEGAAKPELLMPATQQVATARKIAAHVGISWESFNDYDAFVASVQGELMRAIVDAENLQLYGGTGEANGQVNGLTTNANILTLASGAGSENFTDISAGIRRFAQRARAGNLRPDPDPSRNVGGAAGPEGFLRPVPSEPGSVGGPGQHGVRHRRGGVHPVHRRGGGAVRYPHLRPGRRA
jgi:HK97 family phage major capsid protein